jgi:hypothetical protein
LEYLWFKGQGLTLSVKGSKFGSKCDHRCEKKEFFASGFFLFFFFFTGQMSVGTFPVHHFVQSCHSHTYSLCLPTTSFSRVTLTLTLSACHLAYAFPLSPSPLPCLHMHKSMPTALVLASQKDAHVREALQCARIVLGSVWQGSPSYPLGSLTTTLSVMTSLPLFLGVLSPQVQTNPFLVVLTHLDRPSFLNGLPSATPSHLFLMLFVLRSMYFLSLAFAQASCYAHAR